MKRFLDGTNGGRLAFWAKNVPAIRDMIQKQKLLPVDVKMQIVDKARLSAARAVKWPRIPFPGIPVPHLHFEGKIYPVSREQWNGFSAGVIRDVTSKLGRAGDVKPQVLDVLSELGAGIR